MIKRVVSVQFNPWDQVYHFDDQGIKVSVGSWVLVKTDTGLEIGKVVGFTEIEENSLDVPLKGIIRRANKDDLKKIKALEEKHDEILSIARELVTKHQLEMKMVDCYFSFDGGKITLIFTAEGRVDFRELVKNLARKFQKSIRLQQIGIRDEAKRLGGFGPCGRELCCRKFLHNLSSVTTDYARIQQVHSRGSDRISGACGRLMCCLAYELDFYKEKMKKFPNLNSIVKTRQGQGRVVSCNVLNETVNIEIDKNIIEMPLKDIK